LQKKDISNCFVILVTGNQDIAKEIETVRNLHSSDANSIEYYNVNVPYSKQESRQDTFCVLPWLHLYNATDANLYPCCISDFDNPYGSLLHSSVDQIINNQKFCNLRKNMLQNKKTKSCQNCYHLEENGCTSKRQRANKRYSDFVDKCKNQTNTDGSIDTYSPVEVHLSLNNNCNLKCRTCSGYSSSKIAHEEKVLYGLTNNFSKILNNNQRQDIVDAVLPHVQEAQVISFAGGEPSLQLEHFSLLENLEAQNKTSVRLEYNINEPS
jgi:hypothetical protein